MYKRLLFFTLTICFGFLNTNTILALDSDENYTVEFNPIIVQHVETTITLTNKNQSIVYTTDNIPEIRVNGKVVVVETEDNKLILKHKFSKKGCLEIRTSGFEYQTDVSPIPLWMSILPPLIAIFMALIIREVYSALFLGILVGTTIIYFYQGSTFFIAIFQGLFAIVDEYILKSLSDHGHLSIVIFSMLIGAMVNVITKNGGMKGVVNVLSRYAKSARSGQFVTWLLGIAIFFDDYANTLVVGNTMRPVTDRLRISREKLAYIVDSTAAPVASIAFVTTWIGAELSYIQNGVNKLGIDENAYTIFINSLSYAFYPILALIFILILIYRGVDFGPMYKAESKTRREGVFVDDGVGFSNKLNDLEVDEKIKARGYNAVVPVLVIIIGTFIGLFYTGWDQAIWNSVDLGFTKKLSATIGNADSYKALLWSSISGVMVAVIMTLVQRIMNLKDIIDSIVNGFRTMLTAIIILILAWSIALVTEHLHTADFISHSMLAFSLSPFLVPCLTFVLAALVSFSTGSSWGTMAILYPLLLPASWLISKESGLEYSVALSLFHNVVSAVLAGSVLGDHCSPISDTTILSSLASSCNHVEHVRTQLPYALAVGGVSVVIGTLPAAYGVSSWILFPAGGAALILIVKIFGKKTAFITNKIE